MSQLSRKVRIESQKRALVADNLHGQESVLDLTRRRHFAMILSLKRKIKVSFGYFVAGFGTGSLNGTYTVVNLSK